ncbi:MAG: acylglycerol kinase family protein [Streptosporangiaceae bacterium]
MRALLIVNPRATSAKTRDVTRVADELASELNLETAQTRYPSHARELAADAVADGFDLIIPLGGDGTLNEVVNGVMHSAIRAKPDVHAGAGSADPSTDAGPTTGGGPDQLPVTPSSPPGSSPAPPGSWPPGGRRGRSGSGWPETGISRLVPGSASTRR